MNDQLKPVPLYAVPARLTYTSIDHKKEMRANDESRAALRETQVLVNALLDQVNTLRNEVTLLQAKVNAPVAKDSVTVGQVQKSTTPASPSPKK